MKTICENTYDKSSWIDGPWKHEPDRKQWIDEETGLPCLIVRNSMGPLCGYVGVPSGHPWYGMDHDDVHATVHGGLTYSAKCRGAICHVVEPGEDEDVWWLGFDCAHCGDQTYMAMPHACLSLDGAYRDMQYVESECRSLARQASQLSPREPIQPCTLPSETH